MTSEKRLWIVVKRLPGISKGCLYLLYRSILQCISVMDVWTKSNNNTMSVCPEKPTKNVCPETPPGVFCQNTPWGIHNPPPDCFIHEIPLQRISFLKLSQGRVHFWKPSYRRISLLKPRPNSFTIPGEDFTFINTSHTEEGFHFWNHALGRLHF